MLRLFNHYFPSHAVLQVLADAALLFAAILIAVSWMGQAGIANGLHLALPAFLFAVVMTTLSSALGLYRTYREHSVRDTLARIVLSVLLGVPVAYVIFGLAPWAALAGFHSLELTVVTILGAVLAFRGFALRTRATPMWVKRVLVVGIGREAATVEHALIHPENPGLQVVGFYPVGEEKEGIVSSKKILSGERSLMDTVRQLEIDEVIVAVKERRGGVLPLSELLDCKLLGVKILDLSSFFERVRGQVRVDSLRASWLIYGEGFRQGWLRSAVKRVFDIAVSLFLLILTAPLMLVAAIAVIIEDGFPVLYRQERVGQSGKVFHVVKFRSMRRDAEKDGKPRWATSNDDRITRIGRIMRKTRIDELPQLFNVLVGDMSLVGPRPERPFFVDQLTQQIPFYAVRHCLKPGLTGWAQVRYQYGASVDDAVQKLQYDLYYVKNHTLFLDVLILAETIRVVLTGEGAH